MSRFSTMFSVLLEGEDSNGAYNRRETTINFTI